MFFQVIFLRVLNASNHESSLRLSLKENGLSTDLAVADLEQALDSKVSFHLLMHLRLEQGTIVFYCSFSHFCMTPTLLLNNPGRPGQCSYSR